MSRFTQLLKHVEQFNPQLAADLAKAHNESQAPRSLGLHFEPHAPETVELPSRPVRKGDKVRFVQRPGDKTPNEKRTWQVTRIDRTGSIPVAELIVQTPRGVELQDSPEFATRKIEDLVVIAEFRDPIYPGLSSTGKIEHGGDKPFHTVINSENFHALQMMLYTHEGTVDAIYVDPPYNTGARDWKYNNDYVDGEDAYRHSKWLAFMERRLKLAKRLLNSKDSVLIVTIDEKEYLRLGMLLEQTFPEARITMVTSSIMPGGSTRAGTFSRTAEYLYFVQIGDSKVSALPLDAEWNTARNTSKNDIHWDALVRTGTNPFRTTHPNLFYPIYIRNTDAGPIFERIGDPYYGEGWENEPVPENCSVIWPIRRDGQEGRWQISPTALQKLIASGYARLGPWREDRTTVNYLKQGQRKKVEDGLFPIIGHKADGSIITDGSNYKASFIPEDMWRIPSHDASRNGSNLLASMMPDRKFPFPKSLYAVEDALKFFISNKPDAVVLDFFSGSGTTAHAVMRLNKQDGGRRRSISITNNEVGADEQKSLTEKGLRPGDAEWEALGICDYITKPRIAAAVTGLTPAGVPIKGDYKFNDQFPMEDGLEENVEFFTLSYETPRMVAHNKSFGAIAPLLWLRAGSEGTRIDDIPDAGYAVADVYGVLFEVDQSRSFVSEISSRPKARMAFIVTNDDREFQLVCSELPICVEPVRLYESYLTNFTINVGNDL
ncbi:UNVERIFIED_CONTAM: DNA methyltransferase [Actinomycetes bacterium ARC8]|nr:DNA methyltransferase [Actinomycetes bacterium ARC8]